ncbi:hypothetical protein KXS11_08425 [Plantibacter flavus]|uniref:hypothetical protein n=1 Tax=Plantibacter flavus TaxID=150123 RepID=UPI003F18B5CA
MSASATTESATASPAEDVTLADAPTEQLDSEPLADTTRQYPVEPVQPVVVAPPVTTQVTTPTADREGGTQTLSIIAFALSIAAVVSPSFVLLPIASLVLGIIALARKPRAKGFALTSVIISGSMLALALIVAIGAGLVLGLSLFGAYVS